MATAIAVSRVESEKTPLNVLTLIPGILLLAVVGYAGKLLEKFLNTYAKSTIGPFPTLNMSCGRF